jgi:hypothetical protein
VRRIIVLVTVAVGAAVPASGAFAFGGIVSTGNASCVGFLGAAANPNAGVVLQNSIKPALEQQGTTLGEFQSDIAQQHPDEGGVAGLEECIPNL